MRDRGWGNPPETEAILAIGSLALFAYAMWAVMFNVLPTENEKYAMLMLGALIGVVKDTFGRYFQATKGAQDQRIEAAKVAEKAATTAAEAVSKLPAAPVAVTVTNTPEQPVPVKEGTQE